MARAKGVRRRRHSIAAADPEPSQQQDEAPIESEPVPAAPQSDAVQLSASLLPTPSSEPIAPTSSALATALQAQLDGLETMGRREMQALAKEHGVRANLKVRSRCLFAPLFSHRVSNHCALTQMQSSEMIESLRKALADKCVGKL